MQLFGGIIELFKITGTNEMNVIKQWVRSCPKVYMEKLAKNTGTKVSYITYILANKKREPRLRLAVALVDEMNRIRTEDLPNDAYYSGLVLPVIKVSDFFGGKTKPPATRLE